MIGKKEKKGDRACGDETPSICSLTRICIVRLECAQPSGRIPRAFPAKDPRVVPREDEKPPVGEVGGGLIWGRAIWVSIEPFA